MSAEDYIDWEDFNANEDDVPDLPARRRGPMRETLTPAQRKMIEAVRVRGAVERWRFYELCGRGWFRPFGALIKAGLLVRVDDQATATERYEATPTPEEPSHE